MASVDNKKKPEEVVGEEKKEIPEDYYYPDNHIETVLSDSYITQDCLEFHECFGMDSYKRYNIQLLDDSTIIFIAGATYQIYNFETKNKRIFFSKDGGGIGSISVHPSHHFFAVAEKGINPNIYIYSYPDLRLYRILRKGTERSYSNCSFSQNGKMIASVGSSPDFLLCVWDWAQESILLKSKAFSQEIYRVTFSSYQDHILTTSGMGHIRFWKIAETFTGLKLKGEIGKFGQQEISDITSYFEFPDGKVLSGTEYGKLLLWEGNLIKCVVGTEEGKSCHDGAIEVIFREGDEIVSCGEDGKVRFWDFETLDNAEGDEWNNFYLKPNREEYIAHDEKTPAHIYLVCKSLSGSFWILCDALGKIFRISLPDFNSKLLLETNSGKMNGLAISDKFSGVISIGDDATVRLWDYARKREMFKRKFYAKATCVEWLSSNKQNKGRVVLVGFSNGIVRMLLLKENEFFLLRAEKVHDNGISFIKQSNDESKVAIISDKGDIFFLELDHNNLHRLEPFCLYETGLLINSICWNKSDDKILIGCRDGCIYEIKVLRKDLCDCSQTYLKSHSFTKYTIKMMESQKPKRDEMDLEFLLRKKNQEIKEDAEWEPAPILSVLYNDPENKHYIATVDGKYLGFIYIIDPNQERPIRSYKIPKVPCRFLKYVGRNEYLLLGFSDGSCEIRVKADINNCLRIQKHDRDYGKIRGLGFNHSKTAFFSVGEDSCLFAYKCDFESILIGSQGGLVKKAKFFELNSFEEEELKVEMEVKSEVEDVLDDKIYSIQQAKLLAEEDHKKSLAEQKKMKVLEHVQRLRETFENLKKRNQDKDEFTKLKEEELTVDPEYNDMLQKRTEEELEETRKELAWDIENAGLLTKKLKEYVKDELVYDKFAVCGIQTPKIYVKTFKLKKLSNYAWQNLEEIHKLIEEENRLQQEQLIENDKSPAEKKLTSTKRNLDLKVNISSVLKDPKNTQVKISDPPKVKEEEEDSEPIKKGAKYEREKNKREEEEIRRKMEELKKTRPTQDSLDPDHLKEINEAIEKLGDYKLKSSIDYIVPEDKRMNVSKKRKHMFLLQEFIYDTKLKLNSKISELRDRKKQILEKLNKQNSRIEQINKLLGIEEILFQPKSFLEMEFPDHYFEITEMNIDEYTRSKDKNNLKSVNVDPNVEKDEKEGKKNEFGGVNTTTGVKQRKGMKVQHSELEKEAKIMNEMILNAEKKQIQEELADEIENFDKDLMNCQLDKNMIESEMKIAEMKLITYYQELLILNEMEAHDRELIEELFKYRKETENFEDQRNSIEANLNQIRENETETEKKLNDFMKQFKELVYADDDNKRMKIHEYYRKKHKKTKTSKFLKQNEDDEEGEEQVEGEEDDEDFMDDDEDEKPDIQPIENDTRNKEIILNIVELEDEQEKNKKTRQDLERQKSNIASKRDIAASNLKATESKIRDFQLEKVQKVNKLDVSTFLKLSQIKNLLQIGNNWMCPEDLTSSILFTNDELKRLVARSAELEKEEKKNQKQKYVLDKKYAQYLKEAAEKDAKIKDLNAKYSEKHLLKFGEIIDLKTIDDLEPTKQVLEMREKFKLEEKDSIRKVEISKSQLMETKKRLFETKKENTKIITRITNFGELQMKLNKKLDSTNKQLFKEENEDKRNDLDRERENLEELKNFLTKEIEDLKTEISLFKRKGGHIYTMVTSNKKNVGMDKTN